MTVKDLFDLLEKLRFKFLEGKEICEGHYNDMMSNKLSLQEQLILLSIGKYTEYLGNKNLEIVSIIGKYENLTDKISEYDINYLNLADINEETDRFKECVEALMLSVRSLQRRFKKKKLVINQFLF